VKQPLPREWMIPVARSGYPIIPDSYAQMLVDRGSASWVRVQEVRPMKDESRRKHGKLKYVTFTVEIDGDDYDVTKFCGSSEVTVSRAGSRIVLVQEKVRGTMTWRRAAGLVRKLRA
jgi:hypothetical protein